MSIDPTNMLLKRRRTKIVATLGPATSNPEMIERLIRAGVNVFRLNMSHGEHETHRETYQTLRDLSVALVSPLCVLADLSGPKIRVGRFEEGSIHLNNGETVTITTRDVLGNRGLIPSQYKELADDVVAGDRILLADGLLELRVESVEGSEIACRVIDGGPLSDRKGINLPGVKVSAPSLTEKDRKDAEFALELGVDLMALSFVRRGEDIQSLRQLIESAGKGRPLIIAKIEKPEALANIDDILEATDGLMVARGDLGVELPLEQVPVAQNELILRARQAHKPVIVATQMLESMIENARPTRAEVSDVSQAVSAGVDGVMLSGETAVGNYPVEAVKTMDRIVRQTEGHLWKQGRFGSIPTARTSESSALPRHVAVARATAILSRDLMARAILYFIRDGGNARFLSSSRPAAPIIAVTADIADYRQAGICWGVIPVLVANEDLEDLPQLGRRLAKEMGLAEAGEYLIQVRGIAPSSVDVNAEIRVLGV